MARLVTITAPDALLLDTTVFSYFLKRDHPRARAYQPHVEGQLLAVSFVTVGELYRGAFQAKWGQARLNEMEARLSKVVHLPFHEQVAIHWARIQTAVRGRPFPVNDAWIAACAMTYDCMVVSDDHVFAAIPGLRVLPIP